MKAYGGMTLVRVGWDSERRCKGMGGRLLVFVLSLGRAFAPLKFHSYLRL